jgi:hypothetical protein
MRDLKIELLKLQNYPKPWPKLPVKAIHKIFVDDHRGNTIAEFKSESSAIMFVQDNPGMGYSVRIFHPTEEEYAVQCFENRRSWRWEHGMA